MAAAAAVAAWRDRRTGPVMRVVLGALLTLAGMEIAFGRGEVRWLGPLPIPTEVPLGVMIDGAIIGILYGLVGVGIVLVYRATRIISFAQAGLGGVPALLALILITNHHWPFAAAVAVMLVGSALTGLIIESVVLRGFRTKPRLIATIATIGVAQALTLPEIYLPQWLADQGIPPGNLVTPFAGASVSIGGEVFNGNHLAVIIVGGGMVLALTLFFQRTRLGIAMRASAENSDRALLLGIPVARLSTIVWIIAGVCSGIAVFLRASLVGIPVGGVELSPTILLYGLAAAVIARMEKMSTAVFAGMFVGVVEQASFFGTNKPDLAVALTLPIILVALLPRSKHVMRALDTGITSIRAFQEFRPIPAELRHLPEVRALRIAGALAALAVFVAAPLYVGTDAIGFADLVVIFAIVGVSLVILSGWAGQISLGQWAFAGIGAAVAGGLSANHGQDFFVTLAAAGLTGAAFAVLLGIPSLRTQGLYLAVVTLAFAATVQYVLLNPDYVSWLLPGSGPNNGVGRPQLWQRIPTDTPVGFYYLCVAFLVLAYVSARSLRRSRSARVFIATRDNVRAAQAFGVSSARTRLAAFALSGFIAAVAGALFVYDQGHVDFNSFSLGTNIEVFIFVILGGVTSVGGAIAGAVYYEGLHYVAQTKGLAGLDTLGVALGVLLALTFFPSGIAQCGQIARDAVLRAIARRRGMIVPSLLADRRADAVERQPRTAPAAASLPRGDALLVCRGVDVSYDSVQVLFGVDLEVRRGEVVALLGTNGAGKSTLLRAISGLTSCRDGGRISFDGEDIAKLSPADRVRRGIAQVPGGRSIFPTLTVCEHLRIAGWLLPNNAESAQRREDVLDLFPRLRERWHSLAGNLSGGEQQQLGLAMSFLAQPRLLLIDELSLGLSPTVVERLLTVVRRLRDEGTTVLLVEQSINLALGVAERAYFMEKGEVRFEGSTAELLRRDDIVRAVFLTGAASAAGSGLQLAPAAVTAGADDGDLAAAARSAQTASVLQLAHARGAAQDDDGAAAAAVIGGPALEAQELSVTFGGIIAVDRVGLRVAPGEILGVIGPNGAGKTTLFDAISGFVAPTHGRVMLRGRNVTDWSPDDRAWLGLGRSFQDARVFPSMTVAENIATALERWLPVRDHVAAALCLPAVREAEEDVAWSVADLIELLNLQAYRDKFVRELSTGSRRVVDLAMVLAHDPTVLILDEPSSGVAQREAEALAPLLHRIRRETGCAMLVIEHDMPLITAVSDRMMALDLGRVIAEGTPRDVVADDAVVAAYLGPGGTAQRRSGAVPVMALQGEAPA